ncbi:MAG: DUF1566 domain-containing protein [Treponema sp.]|jgi:hypothetical protein|nr:DUF1566 domain-containing protein [Treponema sp.]
MKKRIITLAFALASVWAWAQQQAAVAVADTRPDSIMGDFVAQTAQTITGGGDRAVVWSVQAVGTYQVGDIGPAGGLIFYDKGQVTDGWRYLEAAPPYTEATAQWGAYHKVVPGTGIAVGTGRRNTQTIVDFLQRTGESARRAAQICDALVAEGYDDWFLPGKDELNLMYTNLKARGLGEFSSEWYWSSSENNSNYTWSQWFGDGGQYHNAKGSKLCVRAIRAF